MNITVKNIILRSLDKAADGYTPKASKIFNREARWALEEDLAPSPVN